VLSTQRNLAHPGVEGPVQERDDKTIWRVGYTGAHHEPHLIFRLSPGPGERIEVRSLKLTCRGCATESLTLPSPFLKDEASPCASAGLVRISN